MKPILLILVGPPASGKSSHAKQLVKEDESFIRLCRDDFRLMWKQSQLLSKELEKFLTFTITSIVFSNTTGTRNNIVIDATNCKESVLQDWKLWDKEYNVKFKFFDNSLDTLLTRNMLRSDDKVPVKVIKNMYDNYIKIDQSKYDKV